MQCRSCGQENEQRNKFCGSCGKPLEEERRRAERRIIAWEPHQCRNCGAMNASANKFCGMCGTPLESERRDSDRRAPVVAAAPIKPRPEPGKTAKTTGVEPAEGVDESNHAATSYLGAPAPSSPKPRSEWVRSSGSSFLGLEDDSTGNSDYLLTDEEQSSGFGWRALIVLLILAGVGYLIFKNWDSPTFAAAMSEIHKRVGGASPNDSKPQQQPPSSDQPSISTDENTAASTTPDAAKPAPSTQPPDANKDANQPASTQPPAAAPTQPEAKQPESNGPESKPKQGADTKKSSDATPANDDVGLDPSTAPTEAAKPDRTNPSAPEKGTSQNTAAPGQELYQRGQAYLTGHGAPQSCDQGVVYTRAAAQQGNAEAAVQMGALYATGRCVAQDRVQAYNWFNEALRNDPNNEYVERSRSTLWAQMTSEERQRAARE